MKKTLKKKTLVTVIDGMVAVAAKAELPEEQFKKALDNKVRIKKMLNGVNAQLWFVDNSILPYNLGICSVVTGNTTLKEIAEKEEHVKDVLDQLLEQIDKLPENKPAENKPEKTEETQDAPADDDEEFLKALDKEVEDSLKQHFGEEVKYALLTRSRDHISVDSTLSPMEIAYILAHATEDR